MHANAIKKLNSKPLVEQIIDTFTEAIIKGEFKPGEKIPSEMELCERLQVGRSSLREAIKILVAYGVLSIHRGDGTYIQDSFSEKMLYPVIYGIILQKDSSKSLFDMRQIIDAGSIQLSMDKWNDEMLQQIEAGLENLRKVSTADNATPEAIFVADTAFHDLIVKATHNEILISLCKYMDRITEVSRIQTTKKIIEMHCIDELIRKHEELVDVICRKDQANIGTVVRSHYQFWKDQL